jgi:hypothetical protein
MGRGRKRNKPCDCGVKLLGEGRDKTGRRVVRCSRCRRTWALDIYPGPINRVGRMPKAGSLALQEIGRFQDEPDDVAVMEPRLPLKKNRRGGKPLPEPTDTVKIEGTVIQLRPEEAERFLQLQRKNRLNGLCGPDVESPLIGVKIPAAG